MLRVHTMESLDARRQHLLALIVDEYSKTATPVSSGTLAEKYNLEISPATIRNVMASLEEEGYIYQPHTSAGRIPTEKGYCSYLATAESHKLTAAEKRSLAQAYANTSDSESAIKEGAKQLAHLSQEAVFVSLGSAHTYYTGLSNLFAKPEFRNHALVCSVSGLLDQLDSIIERIAPSTPSEPTVTLGSRCAFGQNCATILYRYTYGDYEGMVGILGPVRMNYRYNIALAQEAYEKMKA